MRIIFCLKQGPRSGIATHTASPLHHRVPRVLCLPRPGLCFGLVAPTCVSTAGKETVCVAGFHRVRKPRRAGFAAVPCISCPTPGGLPDACSPLRKYRPSALPSALREAQPAGRPRITGERGRERETGAGYGPPAPSPRSRPRLIGSPLRSGPLGPGSGQGLGAPVAPWFPCSTSITVNNHIINRSPSHSYDKQV